MTLDLSNPVVTATAALLLLVGIDTAIGILLALKQGAFNIQKLPGFVESSALPYLVPVLVAATTIPTDWTAARAGIVAAAAASSLKLADDIRLKLGQFLTAPSTPAK